MEKENGFEPFKDEADTLDFIMACVAGWLGDNLVNPESGEYMSMCNAKATRAMLLLEDWKNSL